MKKFKIKSGDTVKVIAGDHKGSEGKVLQIIKDKDRVVVENVNKIKLIFLLRMHCWPAQQVGQFAYVRQAPHRRLGLHTL